MLHSSRTRWSSALLALAVLGLSLALLAAVLQLAGYEAGRALGALWRGSFGTSNALLSATLVRATPLLLAGLGVALAFRAGIWNIGAEGQLLAGAASATALSLALDGLPSFVLVPAILVAGLLAGMFWASIAEVLRRRRGVLEVISTIMLNFVALHLVGALVHGPLQEPLGIYPQSAPLVEAARLPRLIPGTRLHLGFLIALAVAPVLWWWLRSTAGGFRLRAVGANPDAARMAGGINVPRVAGLAFLAGGGLAGLAGAIEVSGVTFALYEGLSPGYGYTAIVVALLGRLDPLAMVPSAVLFGALESGALAMQREAGIPSVVVTAIEAVLVLALLLAERRTTIPQMPNDPAGDSHDSAHDPPKTGHPATPGLV